MTWAPNATVTINGVDFTGNTLNNVSVNFGRSSVWEQPRASYAAVEIFNPNNANNNFEVNDSVDITLDDTNGNPITVFTGKVTSITNRMIGVGSIGEAAVTTLSAIGPMATMARAIVGTSAYPKEYDDDRLFRILTDSGVTIDTVDTPGVYEFTARSKKATDAYSLAAYYAQMAFGYIYETTDGKVGYANESRRSIEVATNGYFDIPENYILWQGIQSNKTLSDVLNSVIISYKASATVSSDSAQSIIDFGVLDAEIATELENMSEAQTIADRYITLRAFPQTNLSAFRIELDNPIIDDIDIDTLLNMYMGKPIQILDLPVPILHIAYRGFVEGWSLNISRVQVFMTLISSDSTYSLAPTRWQDVNPALIWSAVDPAIRWYEYE
jgi:hypothetical protein